MLPVVTAQMFSLYSQMIASLVRQTSCYVDILDSETVVILQVLNIRIQFLNEGLLTTADLTSVEFILNMIIDILLSHEQFLNETLLDNEIWFM